MAVSSNERVDGRFIYCAIADPPACGFSFTQNEAGFCSITGMTCG